MAKYVISYRAQKDYVPGREDDMAEWAAWFQSIGEDVVDFGSPVRETIQIGECGAGQRLRGYSVICAALALAGAVAGLLAPGRPATSQPAAATVSTMPRKQAEADAPGPGDPARDQNSAQAGPWN